MNLSFSIWITTACNLRCTYCYEGIEKAAMFLTKLQAEKVVDYIQKKIIQRELEKESKVIKLYIELHGGEPLLNFQGLKEFVEIADKVLGEYDISYQMTTNGTLLNVDILTFLKNHVQSLTVSMDGDKYTHDTYRKDQLGNGTYDIVEQNSRALLKVYPENLRVRLTFNSTTVSKLAANVFHLVNLGFKIIVALPDIFDKNWDESHFRIIDEEIKKINEFDVDNSIFINLKTPLLLQYKGVCTGGCDGENIMPNGDIYPCTMATGIQEFKIGNINEGINAEKIQSIVKYSSKEILECKGCTYYTYCDCVRCKIINKIANGDYLQPIAVQCALNNALVTNNGFHQIS